MAVFHFIPRPVLKRSTPGIRFLKEGSVAPSAAFLLQHPVVEARE